MKKLLGFSKRLLSIILCCTMLMASLPALVASASENRSSYTRLYDLNELTELYLSENEKTIAEYPNGAFMIPLASAELKMKDTYALEIFREGGVKGDASITLKTMDLTAGYGEDYEIFTSLNARAVKGQANRYYDIEEYSFIATRTQKETVYASNQDENVDLVRKATSQYNDEVLNSMPTSSELTLDFKDGENSKTIYIRTYKKREVTDNLQFTLNLCEPKNASIGAQISTAFTILEEREKPETYLSIEDTNVNPESEEAYITVKRTGNMGTTGTFTVTTKPATAQTGVAYEAEKMNLTFTPGMSEIKVPVTMLDKAKDNTYFEAVLDDITVAKSKPQTAKVSITNKAKKEAKHQTALTAADDTSNSALVKTTTKRDTLIVDVSNFKVEHETDRGTGDPDGSWYSSDNGMKIKYDNKWSSSNNAVSVRSPEKIDFTGVKQIIVHEQNITGSVVEDDGMFYVSNSDLFDNNTSNFGFAENLGDTPGTRWDMGNITATYNRSANIDITGERYLYFAVHRTGCVGKGGFEVYNKGASDIDGNVRLILREYNVNVIQPDSEKMYIGGSYESANIASNVCLIDSDKSDGSVTSTSGKFYRDETITLSYKIDTKYHNLASLNGIYLCKLNDDGKVKEKSPLVPLSSDSFKLTSDILQTYSSYIKDSNIYIQPSFSVSDASSFEVVTDNETQQIKDNGDYYLNGELVGNLKWTQSTRTDKKYKVGDELRFTFEPKAGLEGDLDFSLTYYSDDTQMKLGQGTRTTISNGTNSINLQIENLYNSVIPNVCWSSNGTRLTVKNPDYGDFLGKDSSYAEKRGDGSVVLSGYTDGKDKVEFDKLRADQILTLSATPKEGYRAKWSYTNSATRKTQTYYGNSFFYIVQNTYRDTDNHVTLEFVEEADDARDINVSGVTKLQQGSVICPPTADTKTYDIISGALVIMSDYSSLSNLDGTFTLEEEAKEDNGSSDNTAERKPAVIRASKDETHRAMVYYNNQYYITDIKMGSCLNEDNTGINIDLNLDYRTTGVQPISISCVSADGAVYHDSVALNTAVAMTFTLKIDTSGQDPKHPVNMVRWTIQNEDGIKSTFDEVMKENTNVSVWKNTVSQFVNVGDRLFVEPMWSENAGSSAEGQNSQGISYGRWDTGYTFNDPNVDQPVTYAPDIGAPVTMTQPNPVLGPLSPTVSIKGFTPIINVQNTGTTSDGKEMNTITLGVSFSLCSDRVSEEKDWEAYSPLDKAKSMVDILGNYDNAMNNGENPAFAGGKKLVNALNMKTSVYLSFSFLLAYQGNFYVDDDGSWNFVGNMLVAGAGGALHISIPFVLCYIPCFAFFDVSINANIYLGVFGLTDEATGTTVAIPLDELHDAGHSDFQGVYQLNINLGVGVGIGFDALLNATGSVKCNFDIQFNNFLEGVGNCTMSGEIALELLFLKASWSDDFFTVEMFNTLGDHNEIDMARLQSQIETDVMKNITLGDMKIDTAEISENVLSPLSPDREESYIEKTTTNTDPEIIAIGNGKYFIVTATTDANGRHNVLHYYIYDEISDQIIEADSVLSKYMSQFKARDNTFVTSVGEDSQRLDSAIALADCGEDILIAWNKCAIDTNSHSHELFKSVGIATILYNKESGRFHNYKMMKDETGKNIYLAPKVAHNANTGVTQLFYQVMNVEDVNANTTLQDIQEKRTALMTRAFVDGEFTDANAVSINQSFLKYYDVTAYEDDIMLSYVASEHSGFTLDDTTDFHIEEEYAKNFVKTPNALYLVNFEMQDGNLSHSKPVRISRDDTVNANPKFVTVNAGDMTDTLLFFKCDGMYAYQNISDIMHNAVINDNDSEMLLHEIYAAPQYISTEEDYTVNDDLEIFASANGDLYALWTTTQGECQQIWARQFVFTGLEETNEIGVPSDGSEYTAVPTDKPRYALQGYWGGKTYLTKDTVLDGSGNFKEDFSAIVLENGNLLTVYNAFDKEITDEGSKKINNMFVIGEYDTESSYVGAEIEDEITFSDNYPNPQDTIVVSVRASNQGIRTGQNVDVTLYANGKAISTKTEEYWTATEHKTIDFCYTLPENISPDEVDFYYTVSENGSVRHSSQTYNVENDCDLELMSLSLSPLGSYSESNDKVQYQVRAIVKNSGGSDYTGGNVVKLAVVDQLTMTKALQANIDENATDSEYFKKPIYISFGQEKIEPLKPNEQREVVFVTEDIEEKYFDLTGTNTAYLQGFIVSEENSDWKTVTAKENKLSIISEYFPGLTVKHVAEIAQSVRLSSVNVAAGKQQKLKTAVSPASALVSSKVKYTSSNEKVATVNEAGVVTGIRAGEATITATINGVKATTTVKVSGSALIGDVDRDGVISIMDVTYIQKYLAKSENFDSTQMLLADTDGNERITILDATFIQMYIALYKDTERVGEKITIK